MKYEKPEAFNFRRWDCCFCDSFRAVSMHVKEYYIKQEKIKKTREVLEIAYNDFKPTKDSWGNEIILRTDGQALKTKEVISAGPDGKFDTRDDLRIGETVVDLVGVGEKVGEATGKVAIGASKGLYKSIRDYFWGESK